VTLAFADDFGSLSDDQKVKVLFGLESAFSQEAIRFLMAVLDDQGEHDLARIEATKVLGLGAAAAADQRTKRRVALKLLSIAEDDPDDDVRSYAIQALCWLTSVRQIPAAMKRLVLDAEEDPSVREAAYSAVVSQKENPTSRRILNALKADPTFGDSATRELLGAAPRTGTQAEKPVSASSKTRRLLEAWVHTAPKRAERVRSILAESGLDPATIEEALAIKVSKPEAGVERIPTFDPAVSRPVSPMLRQRLAFASTITDGTERWLGVKAMRKALASKKTLRATRELKEHWEGSAPARLRPGQLGLFGISADLDGALTLLAWEGRSSKEPKVVRYSGQRERVFKDLDAFLKWAGK